MSTRATYEFRIEGEYPSHNPITFYIHYDGYPEGAAEYFAAALALKCEAPNANFADAFYRANSRAEFTRGHNAHADTEYAYTVTQEGGYRFGKAVLRLAACEVEGFGDTLRTTRPIFSGTVEDFIAEQGVKVPQRQFATNF